MLVEFYSQQSYTLWPRRQGMRGYQYTPLNNFSSADSIADSDMISSVLSSSRGGIDSNLWIDHICDDVLGEASNALHL